VRVYEPRAKTRSEPGEIGASASTSAVFPDARNEHVVALASGPGGSDPRQIRRLSIDRRSTPRSAAHPARQPAPLPRDRAEPDPLATGLWRCSLLARGGRAAWRRHGLWRTVGSLTRAARARTRRTTRARSQDGATTHRGVC
jgi:hypothetical protein